MENKPDKVYEAWSSLPSFKLYAFGNSTIAPNNRRKNDTTTYIFHHTVVWYRAFVVDCVDHSMHPAHRRANSHYHYTVPCSGSGGNSHCHSSTLFAAVSLLSSYQGHCNEEVNATNYQSQLEETDRLTIRLYRRIRLAHICFGVCFGVGLFGTRRHCRSRTNETKANDWLGKQ
jgi:hypothetical protein